MRSFFQRIIVIVASLGIGFLCFQVPASTDYIWSIKGVVLPVLITILALYTTMSMNLVKELDEIPSQHRAKAMRVLDAIKFELRLELIALFVTFVILIVSPLCDGSDGLTRIGRALIDSLITFDVVNFLIAIIDSFFSYLNLIQSK